MNTWIGIAKTGRHAVMARLDKTSPWVQVESVRGEEEAWKLANELEGDDDKRKEFIEDNEDDWGDDAPLSPPR